LGIDSFEKRRTMTDLKVVAMTWTGHIDCETFIHNFNINVPMRRIRGSDTFTVKTNFISARTTQVRPKIYMHSTGKIY
jgi:hypothetical protein